MCPLASNIGKPKYLGKFPPKNYETPSTLKTHTYLEAQIGWKVVRLSFLQSRLQPNGRESRSPLPPLDFRSLVVKDTLFRLSVLLALWELQSSVGWTSESLSVGDFLGCAGWGCQVLCGIIPRAADPAWNGIREPQLNTSMHALGLKE